MRGHADRSASIPVSEKIRLLDALSATGLRHIVVGSFVSPKWVPRMVDLDALIEVARLAEEVVGHELYGHVAKAGPRSRASRRYPMDMPLVETVEQAQHFRPGPSSYAGRPAPWKSPITSPARDALEAVLNRQGNQEGQA